MKSECTELMAFLLPWQRNSSEGAKTDDRHWDIREKSLCFPMSKLKSQCSILVCACSLATAPLHYSGTLVQTKAKPIPGLLQLQLWLCPLRRNERCAMPCPQRFPSIQHSNTTGSHKVPRGCPCVRTLQKSGQRTQGRQKKNNLQYQQNG